MFNSRTHSANGLGVTGVARAILVPLAIFGVACGSDAQPAARDRVVTTVCNRLDACGELAPGKTYASRDDCRIKQQDYWQNTWPPAECDGKVSSSALDVCVSEVNAAQCGNALDFLSILDKCSRGNVCSGP